VYTTLRRLTSSRRRSNVSTQIQKYIFFLDCALFINGSYVGSGSGSGEAGGGVFECYGGDVVLRLVEDGYVSYEDGVAEVGLLRDCGGVAEVRSFEDGAIYIYRDNACGNGVFMANMPVVYRDVNYPMAMATFGSIFLTLVESIRGT